MQIRTECPTCKNIYEIGSQYEGFEVECEGCHQTFTVSRSKPKTTAMPKNRPVSPSPEYNALLSQGKKPNETEPTKGNKLRTITHHTGASIFLLVTTIIKMGVDFILLLSLASALDSGTSMRSTFNLLVFDRLLDGIWLIALILFVDSHKGKREIYESIENRQ